MYRARGVVAEKQGNAISFGGIPNSRNFFFLQIFLKRAAKPSAGTISGTLLNLTWLHQSLRQNLLRNAVEPDLALHESLSDLHRNLLWNPVQPHLATPNPPRPSPEPSEPSQPFTRTLAGTLLNLTWLCTKASQTFTGTFSGTLLNLTWLCTKASQTFSGTFGTFSGTSLNLTRRLHQCTPELFWAEDPIRLCCWGKIVSRDR